MKLIPIGERYELFGGENVIFTYIPKDYSSDEVGKIYKCDDYGYYNDTYSTINEPEEAIVFRDIEEIPKTIRAFYGIK